MGARPPAGEHDGTSAPLLFALISHKVVPLFLSGLPDSCFFEGWAATSSLGKI